MLPRSDTGCATEGANDKRETQRRRAHFERIFFAKACVQGGAPTDEAEPLEPVPPPPQD